MSQRQFQPGCYLNPRERRVVRITSPYWVPTQPDWVILTEDPNATLLKLRELAGQRKLVPDPSEITWGQIPPQPAS